MRDLKSYAHGYWRSLEHRAMSHDEEADSWHEFQAGLTPETPSPLAEPLRADRLTKREHTSLTRRNFMGASAALAGATTMTGCIRKPVEKIVPYGDRPEDTIPGQPLYYASAFAAGSTVMGVLVESQDGRPTKIEGNPRHSGSQGATDVFGQATVLDIYDPDRTRAPLEGAGAEAKGLTWQDVLGKIDAILDAKEKSQGKGLALVVDQTLSPTMRHAIEGFRAHLPQARVFMSDATAPVNAIAAAELIGGAGARAYHSLVGANVVFAADNDFLALETDHVRLSREWSKTRRVQKTTDFMSRLYVAEASLSSTGTMADNRVRLKSADIGNLVVALAKALDELGVKWPAGAEGVVGQLAAPKLEEAATRFIDAVAADLADPGNKAKTAVLVGERQPAWVHALGLLINAGLGNNGTSVRWTYDADALKAESAADLAKALGAGIDTVFCMGVNPAYDAPADLAIADKLAKAHTIHFGLHRDETAQLAKMHIPVSHWLSSWGDLRAPDGNVALQQPLINPLHNTYSLLEWVGYFGRSREQAATAGELATEKDRKPWRRMLSGVDVVQAYYAQITTNTWSERSWRRWLHDGVVTGIPREPVLPQHTGWTKLPDAAKASTVKAGEMEVNLHLSPKLLDGRHANNGWMQELPHPLTKLTWDNAALVSKGTADKLAVKDGDLLEVKANGATIQVPAFVAPGQADDTISIALGYGRNWGSVGKDIGVNAYALRTTTAPWFFGGSVSAAGGNHLLVSTQDYGTMKPPGYMGTDYPERPIVLEATRKEWEGHPGFVEDVNNEEVRDLKHLWTPPALTGRQQWAMSIDLNVCTGCNTCVIACQAENNIPVVGKDRVAVGREMHWMRIDRYYRGSPDEPTAVVQPMLCQMCESAPCETVCPVAATTHSPEGLNDMAYNRCIGTRYCSNNCPFKVRRFNFFHYNLALRPGWVDDDLDGTYLRQMQKNPDVTIRFRGVMEKCTYCVQRINHAKIAAHVAGKDRVADGEIVTACEQACPTGAIVFGDKEDPDSAVSRAKANSRDYQLLRDLNIGPRTTYLARIRNPNPALGEMHLMNVLAVETEAQREGHGGEGHGPPGQAPAHEGKGEH